jgi:hypothetical protein
MLIQQAKAPPLTRAHSQMAGDWVKESAGVRLRYACVRSARPVHRLGRGGNCRTAAKRCISPQSLAERSSGHDHQGNRGPAKGSAHHRSEWHRRRCSKGQKDQAHPRGSLAEKRQWPASTGFGARRPETIRRGCRKAESLIAAICLGRNRRVHGWRLRCIPGRLHADRLGQQTDSRSDRGRAAGKTGSANCVQKRGITPASQYPPSRLPIPSG